MEQKCRTCKVEKPLEEYGQYTTKKGSRLFKKQCRLCRNKLIPVKGYNKPWGRTVKKHLSEIELFEERYIPEPNSGCWLWIFQGPNGYAYFKYNGKQRFAHRASWEIHKGPIPDGLLVCHKCDVRSCVNPNHLFLGTHMDNNHDMIKKGRLNPPRGEQSAKKLTDEKVTLIFKSNEPPSVLAKKFGVSPSMIRFIKRGESWKHVTSKL